MRRVDHDAAEQRHRAADQPGSLAARRDRNPFAEAYFMIAETSSADIAFTSASGRLNVPDSSSWQ